jgi:PKD repeat protein
MSSTLAFLDPCVPPEPCELISGADFDFAPQEPSVGETVSFTATVTEGTAVLPVTYSWDFGDGVTSTMQTATVTHTFPLALSEQTYTVSLTIANACPSQQTVEKAITVHSYAHVAYLPTVFKD